MFIVAEIRSLANEMVKLVKQIAPNIFNKAGAACDQFGYCPEGKFSCGRAPTLDDLIQNAKLGLRAES